MNLTPFLVSKDCSFAPIIVAIVRLFPAEIEYCKVDYVFLNNYLEGLVLKHSLALLLTVMLSISSLTYCATRIGNKCSLEKTAFEIGRTTKNEVANKLGLPAKMKTDTESGTEYWAYSQGPALASVMLPAVDGNLNASVHTFYNSGAYSDQFKGAAVIYAFNKEGVLIDVKDNRKQAN